MLLMPVRSLILNMALRRRKQCQHLPAHKQVIRQDSATVVALPPQQLYSRATSGTPVIDDPLSSANGSIWYHYNTADNSCAFTGGAYHIKVYSQGGNNTCFAINSEFKNLAFQVQMTIIKGDAGGLLFH